MATYDGYRDWNNGVFTPPMPNHIKKSKLTPAQRQEISYRRMEGEMPMALAAEYGVSRATINTIPKVERPYARS